jgi:5'-methylthioadenosine phosphorylase
MKNAENAQKTVREAVKMIPEENTSHARSALKNAILTDRTKIPYETRQKLGLLVSKYLG